LLAYCYSFIQLLRMQYYIIVVCVKFEYLAQARFEIGGNHVIRGNLVLVEYGLVLCASLTVTRSGCESAA